MAKCDSNQSLVGESVIRPAVISSFSVTGDQRDWAALPADCKYIDVYAFMQRCLPGAVGHQTNAVEHMAQLYRDGRAEEVTRHLQACFPDKLVAALATYIPELTAADSRETDINNGLDALRLLIDVARLLRAQGHPVKVIELVGGSQIQRVWFEEDCPPEFRAARLTKGRSIARLVERLKPVAEYAAETNQVFLSVELEPGPLFILSDANAITRFCRMIEDSGNAALKRCVGLNLDIAHWDFLARISPQWLAAPENKLVRHRIAHAHVCDHHVGHFCDTTLETFNGLDRFSRWFSLLHEVWHLPRTSDMPEFSGFISCEMEACKEAKMLEDCFKSVDALLKGIP